MTVITVNKSIEGKDIKTNNKDKGNWAKDNSGQE